MSVQIVDDELAEPAEFAAHLETSSFCLITGMERAQDLVDILRDRLQHVVTQFYPLKDLEMGSVEDQPLPIIEIYAGIVGE